MKLSKLIFALLVLIFPYNLYCSSVLIDDAETPKYRVVLSIDGGGIRGIIPATILNHIEKQIGANVGTKLDMVGGSSTGGILALASVFTGDSVDRQPICGMGNIVNFYKADGPKIFNYSWTNCLSSLFGYGYHKYNAGILENTYANYFGKAPLSSLCRPAVVTGFDTNKERTIKLKSYHPDSSISIVDALMATTAAPSYFPTRVIGNLNIADGGICMPNPTMEIIAQAKKVYNIDDLKNIRVISLGTGYYDKNNANNTPIKSGLLGWIGLPGPMMSSLPYVVHAQAEKFMTFDDEQTRYIRLDPALPEPIELDNASEFNILRLQLIAESYIKENKGLIDQVCQILKER